MNQITKKVMEHKGQNLGYYMRSLHRDIGFFLIGFIVIYSVSGIVLVYRDTDFLKQEKSIEKNIGPGIETSEIGRILHMKDFKVLKSEGEIISFNGGTYNKVTGVAKYNSKDLPGLLSRFTNLHKTSSRNASHFVVVLFGILLLFLAVSSLWMFKPQTKVFRRAISIAGIGVVTAVVLFFI
jgi:hypothetical protein